MSLESSLSIRSEISENQIPDLLIDPSFSEFINNEVLPLVDVDQMTFWSRLSTLVHDFSDKNASLLKKREVLQQQIDQWHREHQYSAQTSKDYTMFLSEIGYLEPEVEDFAITTENVDAEIATIAGPQLVVPLKNARFTLNAANARWGSLYDALYGTDVLPPLADLQPGYDKRRGAQVIAYGREFLDEIFPLAKGSHKDVKGYNVYFDHLVVALDDDETTGLKTPSQFVAYSGEKSMPGAILLKNHGLHVEIEIDPCSVVGKDDPASVSDILVESAVTTIVDCEDSVAAVDCEDKLEVYQNWLGLMTGHLSETFTKSGQEVTRTLNPDRIYSSQDSNSKDSYVVPGRSLLFIRNVGLLMSTDVVRKANGESIPEGILDTVVTVLISQLDLNKSDGLRNSREGSIYIVKPKMHGPEEVAFCSALFAAVEDMFELERNTVKLGIMDEERRTTVNLKNCIHAAKERVVFINTGFLDRTGDEIHTSMQAGAFLPKGDIKQEPWIAAYEDWNVDIGLACGLQGKAQIGKGMWPMPDEMGQMMEQKVAHPYSGANTAWVPSPTAATLHALHYHYVNVFEVQDQLKRRACASLEDILTIPLMAKDQQLSSETIQQELNNNVQGILGYVVRWIDQGVGCSKVPDIHDVGLMEDRATLRISSQHICNWLYHGICTVEQVTETMQRMAVIVDQQNASDPDYQKMAPDFENSIAYQAAMDLIIKGAEQPSGYTEPLLHAYRARVKQQN